MLHDLITTVSARFFQEVYGAFHSTLMLMGLNVHSKECLPWQKRNASQNGQ